MVANIGLIRFWKPEVVADVGPIRSWKRGDELKERTKEVGPVRSCKKRVVQTDPSGRESAKRTR